MPNPTAPIAQAIAELSKLIGQWIAGRNSRVTSKALEQARRGLNRALEAHPDLNEDKEFKKHFNKFLKYVTIN